MNIHARVILAFLFISCTVSCTTYYIPVEMFKQLYAKTDSSKSTYLHYNGRKYFVHSAAAIQTIHCIDKKGNAVELQNGLAIEIRFTDTQNHKTIFYFDTMLMNDSTIIGSQSRFDPSLMKLIQLNDVARIQ